MAPLPAVARSWCRSPSAASRLCCGLAGSPCRERRSVATCERGPGSTGSWGCTEPATPRPSPATLHRSPVMDLVVPPGPGLPDGLRVPGRPSASGSPGPPARAVRASTPPTAGWSSSSTSPRPRPVSGTAAAGVRAVATGSSTGACSSWSHPSTGSSAATGWQRASAWPRSSARPSPLPRHSDARPVRPEPQPNDASRRSCDVATPRHRGGGPTPRADPARRAGLPGALSGSGLPVAVGTDWYLRRSGIHATTR